MKPHKHAELIKAWADGAEIEWKSKLDGQWRLFEGHCDTWLHDYEYRIKPEPKPDVVAFVPASSFDNCYINSKIKFIFDGETGELKSAEVLK